MQAVQLYSISFTVALGYTTSCYHSNPSYTATFSHGSGCYWTIVHIGIYSRQFLSSHTATERSALQIITHSTLREISHILFMLIYVVSQLRFKNLKGSPMCIIETAVDSKCLPCRNKLICRKASPELNLSLLPLLSSSGLSHSCRCRSTIALSLIRGWPVTCSNDSPTCLLTITSQLDCSFPFAFHPHCL